MLKEERQRHILERLHRDSRIYITTISEELGVSDDTLRRDLAELERQGLLTKVHGGAIARSAISLLLTERMTGNMSAKQLMAAKVVGLFADGDTLLIDGGTSNLEVAKALPIDKRFTVITNSFPIANQLFSRADIRTVFLGGDVDAEGQVTLGIDTYRAMQRVRADWAIIGVSDVHPEYGLFCPKREEALIKRCVLERGNKRVVVAGREKLDTARTFQIATLGDIDYLVSDQEGTAYIRNHWPKGSYQLL